MKNKKLTYEGIIAPLDIANIDTDVIIPKQFLQKNKKNGFGINLFYNWRYLDNNKTLNPNFILNKKIFKNTSILLTRDNFGCGSSREHAPWALLDYGIKVIIATSYADIFYNNAINNKLLLITLNKKYIDQLFYIVIQHPGIFCKIDLDKKLIIVHKKYFNFQINKFILNFIISDLDQIDITMKYYKKINMFEKKHYYFFS
ncbi:3-isopropylmalate dehydratase small subunit [Enterobacteriaceae endosymbiont of Neohaemonia nigricornis]|uniref:3-isopropylmalate dehydratase small subunit n=1 Tax=Enterobacteriaceae endosymbiont of Neohaemonia nigricornis TaxID=2675792 RepID=UPI001448EB43|nr:3-isopropylmalate dehydratase small subunit [Enterobacteriaceae endosymbiont of Neohaemonia nigricornis]QJC30255.1 3-isopropylmalate dehydratase small subunit [Enterobacteriaceae endosymbiont of Neohaemonia nigricornis]